MQWLYLSSYSAIWNDSSDLRRKQAWNPLIDKSKLVMLHQSMAEMPVPCRDWRRSKNSGFRRLHAGIAIFLVLSAPRLCEAALRGQTGAAPIAAAFRLDRILIQPKPGITPETLAEFHASQRAYVLQTLENLGGIQVVSVPAGDTVENLVRRYQE